MPFGAIGMSVFVVDLYVASRGAAPRAVVGVAEFLRLPGHWRVMFDLGPLALFAGLSSVPIYVKPEQGQISCS